MADNLSISKIEIDRDDDEVCCNVDGSEGSKERIGDDNASHDENDDMERELLCYAIKLEVEEKDLSLGSLSNTLAAKSGV